MQQTMLGTKRLLISIVVSGQYTHAIFILVHPILFSFHSHTRVERFTREWNTFSAWLGNKHVLWRWTAYVTPMTLEFFVPGQWERARAKEVTVLEPVGVCIASGGNGHL